MDDQIGIPGGDIVEARTDCLSSFIAMPVYHANDASTAFESCEVTGTIQSNATPTEIESKKAGYNDAEFFVVLGETRLKDGDLLVLTSGVDEEAHHSDIKRGRIQGRHHDIV